MDHFGDIKLDEVLLLVELEFHMEHLSLLSLLIQLHQRQYLLQQVHLDSLTYG